MTLWKTLTRAAGLGLCVVVFTGSAVADPGNGNGGPASTPPGQVVKAQKATEAAPDSPAAQKTAPASEQDAASEQSAASEQHAAPAPQSAAGQAKKAENQSNQAARKAAPAKTAAVTPAQASSAKASAPGQATKAEKQAENKPVQTQTQTQSLGRSAEAQHHVVICHRTGSDSNPYVVINIPTTAWHEAHSDTTGSHPPKNDRKDKMLKDPASAPGSKDGFTKQSSCGAPAVTTSVTPPTVQTQVQACPPSVRIETVVTGLLHATGAFNADGSRKFVEISPNQSSAHFDASKHGDQMQTVQRTVTVSSSGTCETVAPTVTVTPQVETPAVIASPVISAVQGLPPLGGVAGAVSPAAAAPAAAQAAPAAAQAQAQPSGGVLGAVASAPEAIGEVATGSLPFTGMPLWIVALLGGALLAGGLVLRRATS